MVLLTQLPKFLGLAGLLQCNLLPDLNGISELISDLDLISNLTDLTLMGLGLPMNLPMNLPTAPHMASHSAAYTAHSSVTAFRMNGMNGGNDVDRNTANNINVHDSSTFNMQRFFKGDSINTAKPINPPINPPINTAIHTGPNGLNNGLNTKPTSNSKGSKGISSDSVITKTVVKGNPKCAESSEKLFSVLPKTLSQFQEMEVREGNERDQNKNQDIKGMADARIREKAKPENKFFGFGLNSLENINSQQINSDNSKLSKVQKYRLISHIGDGGFGEVYLVEACEAEVQEEIEKEDEWEQIGKFAHSGLSTWKLSICTLLGKLDYV